MGHSAFEVALVGESVVGIEERALALADAVAVLALEAQSVGEAVDAVAVLLAVDELALVGAGGLLERALAVEVPVIEGPEVLVLLVALLPAQLAVRLAAVVELPVELVRAARLLPLAVETVPLELALVAELPRPVGALALGEVVPELAGVMRAVGEDEGAFSLSFALCEVADVERVVLLVELAQSVRELSALSRCNGTSPSCPS